MRITIKKSLLAALLLCTSLLAAEPSYAVSLYFPHVDTTYGWQTEIAIINTSPDQTVYGTLRGVSNKGQLIDTREIMLSARGRIQITVADEFINHADIGYIVFDTDSSAIQGYIKFYKQGKYRVAIPAVKEVNTSNIYITHIDSGIQWWTGVSLVNTTSETKNITITFNTGETRTITLNANEHKPFLISNLFNNQTTPSIQSAVITNASGIIGLEVFGTYDDKQLEGILLTDKTASTLYYPYVVGGDMWTGIVAYNPSESACTITITPYNSQGTVLSSSSLSMPGKSKYVGFITDLSIPADTAWFKIDSTSPLSGFELIGTNDYEQLAAYAGNGGTGAKAGILPKVEKSGWTVITFVNTEASAASITLTGYDDNGTAVGTQVIPIDGHANYVGDATSINATYIAYSSDRNVVAAQLNGTADWTMLDGLPGLADPTGTSPPGKVDLAQGGVISTASGVTVTVFKGSGAGEITVIATGSGSVGVIGQQAYVASLEYEISVQGLDKAVLTAPLQVTIPIDLSKLTSSNVRQHMFYLETYDETTNTWLPIHSSFEPEYDSTAQTVTFLLTDISNFQTAASGSGTAQMEMDSLPASRVRVRDTLQTWDPVPDWVVMDGERYLVKVYEGASHFSIHYYTSTNTVRPKHATPSDAEWQSTRIASYRNPNVPDYIEDLGAALDDAYAFYISNVPRSDGPNLFTAISGKTEVEVIDFEGDATGDYSFFKEKIRIKPNLKDWTELRTSASHELAHRMCDQHYTKIGAYMNLWFFEATANLYAVRACSLDSASTLEYYGKETGEAYIGGSIYAPVDSSMYSVAHFLDWLEKTDSKAYVADVVYASTFSDLTQLDSTTGNKLGDKLGTYVREAVLSDKKWGKISIQKSALIKSPNHSSRVPVKRPPLSAELIAVKTDTKADCLLVAPTGAGVSQNSVATYSYADDANLPVSDTEAWLEKNTPADNPIVVKHFGAVNTPGVTTNTFYQLVVNQKVDYDRGAEGELSLETQNFDYYVLVPPTVTQVGEGAVVWSTEGQQGIPMEFFASGGGDVYDVYDANGTKLNSKPIGLAGDSFEDPRIKFGDKITVVVKDKFGNVWPEPPLSTGARVLQTKQLTFVCPAGTTNAYPGAEIEILGGSWNGTGTVFTATIRNAAGVEASYTAQFTTDFKSLARYAEYLTLEGQERQGLEIYNVPLNTLQSILPSQYVYTLSGEEGIGHVTKAYTSMWMRTGVCSGIDHSKPFFFRLRLVR